MTGPEAIEICRRAGVLYTNIGELDAAVHVLRLGGQLLLAGQLLARSGRRTEAVAMLVEARDYLGAAQIAREMGDDRKANLLMAERAHNDGRLGEAAEHLERAGELGQAGRFFELVGQHARAAAAYQSGGYHEAAAILFERLGQTDAATTALRAAGLDAEAEALANRAAPHDESIRQSVVDGDFFEAASAALTLARQGERERYPEVIAYLEEVRPSDARYFECRTMLAEVLEETGDTKRALSVLAPMFIGARPEPRHVPAMYQYGRLLELEGFLAGARNAYQTVAAFDPSYRDLQARLRTLRESDVSPAVPQIVPPERVPTLPMIVGGPDAKSGVEVLEVEDAITSSDVMAVFDRELQAMGESLAPVPDSLFEDSVSELEAQPSNIPAELNNDAMISDMQAAEELPAESSEQLKSAALVGLVLRGRFRIERKLGRGAQAQVYLARDQLLDREVAIKVLNEAVAKDKEAIDRFLGEARLAAKVHHAGCLAIFDFGQERGLTFMAMEYFKGRTLRDAIKKGPLKPYVAMRIARDVAAALGAVHEAGIVHRDIKPTNVMVDKT
ncbi:MAG: protein kinase, partial [Myxococcota bacterium]